MAKKPLLFFGEKIKFSNELIAEIRNFCHQHQVPYCSNLFVKGILDESDPLSLGMYNGIFSSNDVRSYIESEVDYILEIGTSIFSQDSGTAFATGTHVIDDFPNKTTVKGTEPSSTDILGIFSDLRREKIPTFEFCPRRSQTPKCDGSAAVSFRNLTNILNELQEESSETLST